MNLERSYGHIFQEVCERCGRDLNPAEIKTAGLRENRIEAIFLFWPQALRESNKDSFAVDIEAMAGG